MIVLGIETSGLEGSVALIRGQEFLDEHSFNQPGRRHAQSLVLQIHELLQKHGFRPFDVNAVAVSRGPGSFTGLRVGMVCAKTFAYATGCRFVAVDTFAAIAENLPNAILRVDVIEDAQREDLFVGRYQRDEQAAWKKSSAIQIVTAADYIRDLTDSDVVTGPGLKKLDLSTLRAKCLTDPVFCHCRASAIAKLGQSRLSSPIDDGAQDETDFWKAVPFYLRMSAAEEKRSISPSKLPGPTP